MVRIFGSFVVRTKAIVELAKKRTYLRSYVGLLAEKAEENELGMITGEITKDDVLKNIFS